tara:strand:- start:1033 stop:1944 length:912 start_codon:yes stop_codon:yes gene_type:complete
MSKLKIILTVGISCSGKTTWTNEFIKNRDDWVDLNRDEYRFFLFNNGVRDWSKYKFNRANEKKVTDMINHSLPECVKQNKNIIISDTNLNPKYVEKWKLWAEENDYEFSIKEFPITYDEALKRDNARAGGVGHTVLWSQWLKWLELTNYDFYKPDTSKQKAFIVDIDGTIAKVDGRGFFDWDKVGTDKPRKEIIEMVSGLIESGLTLIFLSGRDGSCIEETYDWIMRELMFDFIPEDGGFHLFMRTAGDNRKDAIIKKELFDEYIRNNFNIVAALDDRPCMSRLWNQMKIPNVITVADPLLEF